MGAFRAFQAGQEKCVPRFISGLGGVGCQLSALGSFREGALTSKQPKQIGLDTRQHHNLAVV